MDRLFEPYKVEGCCLCGSGNSLSGEHKIKASALRKIFGQNAMMIGSYDSEKPYRPAQGPKSEAFHFTARMCALCNGSLTQPADLEFDKFHELVTLYTSDCRDPSLVFALPQYRDKSERFLNVFRYFSKLLCCHVSESGGPRPTAACEFALGRTNYNIVSLSIDADPTYEAFRLTHGEHQYAAHGGLIVPFDRSKQVPTGFRSSITLGAIRYVFWVQFDEAAGNELRIFHHEFWQKCEAAFQEGLKNPLSDEQRHRLGI